MSEIEVEIDGNIVKANQGDSIISIAETYNLEQVFVRDTSMTNFVSLQKQCEARNKQLIFGVKFNICHQF